MKFVKYILFILLSFYLLDVCGQSAENNVVITASGSGATQEAAKQAALRSAIEQSFGTFISAKTEMLNDQVIADEMVSVTSGNIKYVEVLNETQLPDGRWGVTLKTIVSVDKLTSFVESKGGVIEIQGGMFAMNIKQQLLNEQGEIKAVAEMVGLLHEPMQLAFDFTIKSGNPKSIDLESKKWEIPLEVTATCNKNIDFCANYFIRTLSALAMNDGEVASYKSLNKKIYSITVEYAKKIWSFNLRKKTSYDAIVSFASNWEFYTRSFKVNSGIDEIAGMGKGSTTTFFNADKIDFKSDGNWAATYSWGDVRSLSQIEQMKGYSVKAGGIISSFRNGGYVVYEEDGHGFVVALIDVAQKGLSWQEASDACGEFAINGYNDWELPSIEDLQLIYKNLFKLGIGGLDRKFYWSSSRNKDGEGFAGFHFHSEKVTKYDGLGLQFVRAVRAF